METATPSLTLLLFLSLATGVAMLTRVIPIPYTVGLVLVGLLVRGLTSYEAPHLTKDLLFTICLPALLYEAAFHLEAKELRATRLTITVLAVPGLFLAVGLTALLLTPAASTMRLGFSLEDGLLFGALIAATDPVAVVGVFKSFGVSKRLETLIEGESLFNDGTAIVLFLLVSNVVRSGELTLWQGIVDFVLTVGLGVVVGAVLGFGVAHLTRRFDDPMIEIALTMISAYGSFMVAEGLHASGVIATVIAGMFGGNYATRIGMSDARQVAVESFWSYVAFALNSLVFLLIGFEVQFGAMVRFALPIVVAFVAVTAGRALMVFAVTAFLKRTREAIPWSWATILTWGGLRGALSMVLALGLSPDYPHREFFVTLTFGVVVLSLLLQGLTLAPLLSLLGLHRARLPSRP